MSKRKREESKKKLGEEDDMKGLEEAVEEKAIIDDEEGPESSEGEGEDLDENLEKDYKPIPGLDEYNKEELDEEEYEKMDFEERKKVEEELNKRDQIKLMKSARIPVAIMEELEASDEEDLLRRQRRKNMKFTTDATDNDEYKDTENYLSREDVKGKLSEWLRQPHVIRYIQQAFIKFIKGYKDEEGKLIYEARIIEMSSNNKQSLEVGFPHISSASYYLARWIVEYPSLVLPILNEVAFGLTCEIFPQYSNIFQQIFVRIRDLPDFISLRNLRYYHLGRLVKIKGVVTKRTTVFPQLIKAFYSCSKCGEKKGPFYLNSSEEVNLGSCLICQSKGPYTLEDAECLYRNFQKLTIQESPGTVPPGRVPRQKEIIVTSDLVDTSRPGDEVELTGIYISRFDLSNNIKHSFPVFSTFIEANCIKRLNDIEIGELTDEDKLEIRKLAKNPNIAQLIFDSIAPSIYGHDFIKRALAIAMFGGVGKDIQGKHKIRGDINILLLGDPGTAKSQFLKYLQKAFHRCVYTTGKGASAVGLTAGVHKDPVTREWTLEGGALVLADKGICLIDEFDKMNDQDRTSIHEAMEQQSISISKAGIVTSLQARCSVIAAANPIKGKYDNQLTFSDNVDLTDPILSRFDILCVVKDEVNVDIDTALATFVINSHIMSHPQYHQVITMKDAMLPDPETENKEVISQDILKKYIMYARKYIQPKFSDLNKNKISKFYSELRKESELVGGMPIAVRHLESLLRIAEAHAKMHLREYVRADDIELAIKVILESFLQSQKFSISRNLRKRFSHYLTQQEDHIQLLMNILQRMTNEQLHYKMFFKKIEEIPKEISVRIESFEKESTDMGIHNFDDFYSSTIFKNKHKIIDKYIICDLS